jgi:hypothetical protein
MLDELAVRVDAADRLVHRGRYVDATVLLQVGSNEHLISIRSGRVTSVTHGPLVFPSWDFALRAAQPEWDAFWSPVPAPGHHDLFAMLKRKQLRIEGNLHPFMANLRYFKELLALLREPAA